MHPEKELSILMPYRSGGRIFHQARHFNVICNTIQCDPDEINLHVDYRLILPQMEVRVDRTSVVRHAGRVDKFLLVHMVMVMVNFYSGIFLSNQNDTQ